VLPNGTTVLAAATRTTPAITIQINVRAGTACDPETLPGLAYFVSRTIDRGSETYSAEAIAEQLDGCGVTLSSTVGRHLLSLTCACLTEDFDRVLALLGDVVMRPVFPDLEVEKRRAEIVTLIRQDEDNPAVVAVDTLMPMLYGERHPYGRRMRGTVDTVAAIEGSRLREFHAAWFAPPALSVVVVGDVDLPRAVDRVMNVFESWNGRPRLSLEPVAIPDAAARRTRIVPMMNKSQCDIAYGFTSVARADPDYHAWLLMNNILGQYSLGGRLGDSIRERQGMAYYVFSSLEATLLPGPLIVRAGVSAADVQRAVASIDAELTALADAGPTERELAESKQYLIGSMPRALETNLGIAAFLQTLDLFGLDLDYDVQVAGLLRAVTLDDVHRVARRGLDPARATLVVAGPYEGVLS
jgi:zinc protease